MNGVRLGYERRVSLSFLIEGIGTGILGIALTILCVSDLLTDMEEFGMTPIFLLFVAVVSLSVSVYSLVRYRRYNLREKEKLHKKVSELSTNLN